ncbi:unnamed protein product [Sympodiomycopsis kandeliae]
MLFKSSMLLWLGLAAQTAFCVPVSKHSRNLTDEGLDLSLGHIAFAKLSNGVRRFTLPFAEPPIGNNRFASPQPIKSLPANFDSTQTPASCYQYSTAPRGGNTPSEDCLYMNVFLPQGANPTSRLPILVWLPGGSFVGGSATADGLDGSKLASEQNMIVIVAQYRLGLFGWMQTENTIDEAHGGAPGSDKVAGNQAARDVVAALNMIQDISSIMGGDKTKVTLSGQSSGAHMVRALLSTPTAQPLFSQAILVSDTENYGMASQSSQNKLGAYGLDQLGCKDLACARNQTADDVMYAGYAAYSDVPQQDDSYAQGEPWRPALGAWITSAIERAPQSAASKHIMLTTVSNEAGNAVGSIFAPTAAGDQEFHVQSSDGNTTTADMAVAMGVIFHHRGQVLASDPAYSTNSTLAKQTDGMRELLEDAATDGLWRCANQKQAVNLASTGHGNVYLAQHMVGSQYPSNAAVDYCKDHMCHEDDIFLIFGTLPSSATATQKAVSKEMRSRWGSFVASGSPNARGYPQWKPVASADQLNIMMVGMGKNGKSQLAQTQRKAVCQDMWGAKAKFDWQLYS